MSFPGFPIGLPKLPDDCAPLAEHHRAYVDALPAHQRHEAEWTLRSIDAAFARAKPDLQDALRNESYREGLGMTEAKRAAAWHWACKRSAA